MHNTSKTILAAIALAAFNITPSFAGVADVTNIADTLHPGIHGNVGGGNNANPNGVSPQEGGNLHGIANTPGKAGTNPNDDGTAGFANELNDVHGGIGEVNNNVMP